MPSAEERFRAKVVRRQGHEVWTGSTDHRGVGMVRIDGKLRTVQRAAWEFAYGPLSAGVRVNTCAGERACVRIDHLSVTGAAGPAHRSVTGARRPKGSGSIRRVRPGAWEVEVSLRKGLGGRRRRTLTVHGDRGDAEQALAVLAASVRHDLGDLRVGELVGRLLEERAGDGGRGLARDRHVLREVIEPAVGQLLAADLSGADIEGAFIPAYRAHGTESTRLALGLVRDAYRWAMRQGWCDEDPTAGITLRTLM
jgi:hypothetical protein